MNLLAGKSAAIQDIVLADAETEVRERLWEILSSATAFTTFQRQVLDIVQICGMIPPILALAA